MNLILNLQIRLRVVSKFGDSGEIHARTGKWAPARRRAMRVGASPRGSPFSRARVFRPESPKIDCVRSGHVGGVNN